MVGFLPFSFLYKGDYFCDFLSPVVQSIISLKSSLVVKMLPVLVRKISYSQVFLLKNVSSFCKCKSYSHFFSKNISVHAILNDQSFYGTLTNDIVTFEQLGPVRFLACQTPPEKKSILKWKNLLPRSKFFPFRVFSVNSFSEGRQQQFWQSCLP